jgi:hypothetical protein
MFAIVVFLCGIVTIMLICFICFHSYLICKGYTTNEFAKRQNVYKFINDRLHFLTKWEKARDEGKAFKPSEKAIDKYHIANDLQVDMSTESLKERVIHTAGQESTISRGSFFTSESFFEALLKIYDPDVYDIDGNKKPVSIEKPQQKKKPS